MKLIPVTEIEIMSTIKSFKPKIPQVMKEFLARF
jgi:hypothetical protein